MLRQDGVSLYCMSSIQEKRTKIEPAVSSPYRRSSQRNIPPFGSRVEVRYSATRTLRSVSPSAGLTLPALPASCMTVTGLHPSAGLGRGAESHMLHLAGKRWIRVDAKLICTVGPPPPSCGRRARVMRRGRVIVPHSWCVSFARKPHEAACRSEPCV